MKIAIILGSTRPGRFGAQVADWVMEQVAGRDDAEYVLVDLAEYDLDLLNEPTVPGAAKRQYDNPKTRRWSETIDQYDGFVFVTPEYNHGVPGAFKNAYDSLGPEWVGKPVAFVSYGAESGVRAVEAWRQIVGNFNMFDIRNQLSLNLFTEFGDDGVQPNDRRPGELSDLLDMLVKIAGKLAA